MMVMLLPVPERIRGFVFWGGAKMTFSLLFSTFTFSLKVSLIFFPEKWVAPLLGSLLMSLGGVIS